ncbi:MAG: type ISP restriction/modification enzyme [Parvularculaceae bacterium]
MLNSYRERASSEREKGDYFERLVRTWLQHAPTQQGQFLRVLTYGDWAAENRLSQQDTGIDLVAQLADSPDDWCAVQCKFYASGYRIQKADIDSFFTASGKRPFTRRLIVDSTGAPWSEHAAEALVGQTIPCNRIGLADLEESGIDWEAFAKSGEVHVTKKSPRPHQLDALKAVQEGLAAADRGKLIMACGTGKTYTALQIAQAMAGRGGRVLFLVPSLSLMSQTIREWSVDSTVKLRSFAVCSDVQVGVRKARQDDLADISATDLEIPATTLANVLAAKASKLDPDRMTTVFSTYHSIQAVADAQSKFGLPEFDLIICDEAHRTTGATLAGEEESAFVKVHDAAFMKGKKRLYMTATPRIFGEAVQKTADEAGATLASMDDESLYGQELFTRNFSWAVQKGLLTDYKVIVLAVDEASISEGIQRLLADGGNELKLDDVSKIVGCYKALTKTDLKPEMGADPAPMRRALAFAKTIKASQLFEAQFARVAEEWRNGLDAEPAVALPPLTPEVRHVDGGFSANMRNERLSWLKEDAGPEHCRILTNARCLSEGVDVPALDAILFLHPRKSQIDVVQSVGRVMRRAEGKNMGYVILPIGVPAGVAPERALDDNERYKIVWQILNALRAHDDRLDATINKIDLGVDPGERIEIVAVTNDFPVRAKPEKANLDIGGGAAVDDDDSGDSAPRVPNDISQRAFDFPEYARAIKAKIVKKCGTRAYWENWAGDVARIAEIHITRIKAAVERAGSEEKAAFDAFLEEIRDDLNDSITSDEAIEMLAQHLITKPVFDALFEGYAFAANNPVSRALDQVLSVLERQNLEKETESLDKFYRSVRMRAADIDSATAKQKIVVELYDTFFKTAFPKLAQRLGIVYTPVEVVDFIIKSVDEVLREEFGQTLSSEGVHIIDPFVGTGTFITRLLHSGLIQPEDLPRKFAREIHANEIVLLAYYIAAINIEATYHELTGEYAPFPGICLTDTFQLYEKEDLISGMMADNSSRRMRQKTLPIKVIVGNPPYSVGQGDANANNQNLDYPNLDVRIAETYAQHSTATNKNALYDSYVRAIRWGSDRLKDTGGVLALVTNAGWIDANTADGMRKCLAEEFTRIDVFHLRGNQRTQGEQSRKEGGKIFGQGSRAPVAITVLTLKNEHRDCARIRLHDIGDYLSREQKLARVTALGSLGGISSKQGWQVIAPDKHNDWLAQRDETFNDLLLLGSKSDAAGEAIFSTYSQGMQTARDAWCINYSRAQLLRNTAALLESYEAERARFSALGRTFRSAKERDAFVDSFVTNDSRKISWSRALKADIGKGTRISLNESKAIACMYRPFSKHWAYFDRDLNEYVFQMWRLFPSVAVQNSVICLTGVGEAVPFSALMTNSLTEFKTHYNGQNFPRYVYDQTNDEGLFASRGERQERRDAITDAGLKHFTDAYPGQAIIKDDLFYFVYGVLHSPDYRARYADNLRRQLPRMPILKRVEDFLAFVEAGRILGELHINYETVEPYPVSIAEGDLRLANIVDPVAYFRVEKMKFAGKRPKLDKTTVIYNPRITITNIPLAAYEYVVNGKPALEWVMERQCVSTDPASGIVNDANLYATETVGDPRYPFDLFCRIITVSLETMKVVKSLPQLDIRESAA